ncbi:MAG: virulence protein [Firmicutes bacterium]|nr:virulence protein [Bacillota bacterium]
MILKYNLTGEKRRQLVGIIVSTLNKPVKYNGVPTFSYEVGGYTIDKNGKLTGPDNLDLEDALHQAGFEAQERNYDEPDTYESGLGGMGAVDYFPNFEDLQMDEHEELGLGRTRREDFQGENGMQASDVPEPDSLTIEMPLTGFTETAVDNLRKLVASKRALIKKAIGTDELPIIVAKDTISFPWFKLETVPAEVNAYTHFISVLCDMAKTQKRVNGVETKTDNEKFAMRTFLLRLGFIGPEFKEYRKILLKNLSGSSAYARLDIMRTKP